METNFQKPLYSLSVGEFVELIKDTIGKVAPKEQSRTENKSFVKGIVGISKLFGVSHKTAQEWKNTWLAPACTQRARTILVDTNKAIELFNERRAEL